MHFLHHRTSHTQSSPYLPSRTQYQAQLPTIPIHTSSTTSLSIPVPLPLYFQILDLTNAGHTPDSVLVHIVATNSVSDLDVLRDTVAGVLLNLRLIEEAAAATAVAGTIWEESRRGSGSGTEDEGEGGLTVYVGGGSGDQNDGRRNSRIEFVAELDDLGVARLVAGDAEKEEEEEVDGDEKDMRKGMEKENRLRGLIGRFG